MTMSECKHEPIEVVFGLTGPNGEICMRPLLFSDIQPPARALCSGLPPVAEAAVRKAEIERPRYAMMGCRHCKAPYIDVIPDVRVIQPNTDPFRTEGEQRCK
jgi:hypothetical protein